MSHSDPIAGAEGRESARRHTWPSSSSRVPSAAGTSIMAAELGLPDDIAMDNPLGGIRRGWETIRSGIRAALRGPRGLCRVGTATIHESPDMFYAVGRERGHLRAPSTDLH
jgi:hypothetical protein